MFDLAHDDLPEKESSISENKGKKGFDLIERYQIEGENEVVIWHDRERNSYFYEVKSATENHADRKTIESLRMKFISSLEESTLSDNERREKLRTWIQNNYDGKNQDSSIIRSLVEDLEASLLGYGRVDALMKDENVEDISCGGFLRPVFVYHKKYGSMETNISFEDEKEVMDFVTRMAERSGAHISVVRPIVECSLPDGSRFQGTYGEEITKNGSTFSIRKFLKEVLTPVDLLRNGTMSVDAAAYIWQAVESGLSFFIVGGTASGKTTTLNAILLFVPSEKKIISIEDTRELNIPHSNWIPLYTRQGKGGTNPNTGKRGGEIDMFDLLTMSLRQRADYIVVGEVRGQEAKTFFQAMSSGQSTMSTFHASDIASFIHRLEGPPIEIPRALISSLDIIIFQGTSEKGGKVSRKVIEILEMEEYEGGELVTRDVLTPETRTISYSKNSPVIRKILSRGKLSYDEIETEIEKKKSFMAEIMKRGNMSGADFSENLSKYYLLRREQR
ncbi:MAG: type II/IV secretion system ATPase subunit [Thermoplasmatales archaeon]